MICITDKIDLVSFQNKNNSFSVFPLVKWSSRKCRESGQTAPVMVIPEAKRELAVIVQDINSKQWNAFVAFILQHQSAKTILIHTSGKLFTANCIAYSWLCVIFHNACINRVDNVFEMLELILLAKIYI